jgi:hypothetical protein
MYQTSVATRLLSRCLEAWPDKLTLPIRNGGRLSARNHGLLVFHRATQAAAEQILRSGFRDHTARYLTEREWTGVWVSDRPLDNSEGASGDTLLQIEIAEEILTPYEWVKEGKHIANGWSLP